MKNVVHNPLRLGLINNNTNSFEEFLLKNSSILANCTYINDITIKYSDGDFILPRKKTLLINVKNKTYQVKFVVGKNEAKIKLIANFKVKSFNNRIDVKNKLFNTYEQTSCYNVQLVNSTNQEVSLIIDGDAKFDLKKFQSVLNQTNNGFCFSGSAETYKEFVSQYLCLDNVYTIYNYHNPGILKVGEFLYKNAFVKNDEVLKADSNNCIQLEKNKYIKLSDNADVVPFLSCSKRSPKEVTSELLNNIVECWKNNSIYPLIALGHMVMSIFFPIFKKQGVPTLILFGETSTGKSTIAKVGLAIYGLSPNSLLSGGSTVRGWEHYLATCNGMCICIDDVKEKILASSNFTEISKTLYNAIIRTRMKNFGQNVDQVYICSPLVCSTNEKIPNLKEVENRINVVEMFGNIFNPDKFNYHETNSSKLEELSIILPELIKIDSKKILTMHQKNVELLETNGIKSQRRVLSNLAYAYTGLQLLMDLAENSLCNIQDNFLEFAKKQINKYNEIEDVVDKVLSEISVQFGLGKLLKDIHFRVLIEEQANQLENVVYFNPKILIALLNNCNSFDKSKYIDISLFKAYCRTHKRFRGEKTVRYKTGTSNNFDTPCKSVGFCIDGLEDYMVFLEKENANKPVSTENVPF